MPQKDAWILKEPIDTFFFDCDGTLSLIEGIDVLATRNHVADKVHAITSRCMSTTGLSLIDYKARLDYVRPTLQQVEELGQVYLDNCAPGARETIQLLQSLNKKIYILSAGIKAAVCRFAATLGVPAERVLAVDVYFDDRGLYQGFDEDSNLVQPNGKSLEIALHVKPGQRSLLLGDGMSDWEAKAFVTRFIGFAGLHPKAIVQNNSELFIAKPSLFPVIPLGLIKGEVDQLSPQQHAYYLEGLSDIQNELVFIKELDNVQYSSIR